MRRSLRLLLRLPLLATTACAADAIAAPAPAPEALVHAAPAPPSVEEPTPEPSRPAIFICRVTMAPPPQVPLYVVDGVAQTGARPDVNANDIESIEYLKGASASSLYGSRAASGAVIIWTRGAASRRR